MKKTESLFVCSALLTIVAIGYAGFINTQNRASVQDIQETKYGAFLAAQHAVYINDFEAAAEFSNVLDAADGASVKNIKIISDFVSGRLPQNASELAKESGTPARLVYDAYLVGQGD